jgi:hypothetical protein
MKFTLVDGIQNLEAGFYEHCSSTGISFFQVLQFSAASIIPCQCLIFIHHLHFAG